MCLQTDYVQLGDSSGSRGGNVTKGRCSLVPMTDKRTRLSGRLGLKVTMGLQSVVVVGCIILCISGQLVTQQRRCAFQVKPQNIKHNIKYMHAGSVNESVQLCSHTQCCVGYFLLVDNQTEVDLLACNVAEICQDATCEPQYDNQLIKCVCNEDMCNRNITWSPTWRPQPNQQQPTSYIVDKVNSPVFITVGAVLFALLVLLAVKWRHLHRENGEKTLSSVPGDALLPLCSCRTSTPHLINGTDVGLQQAVGRGHFATVWQGEYQGSVVAVKVFPAACKQAFSSERDVYELPLMEHPGIARFLGAGRSREGSQWMMILELASCGSLQHFLCNRSSSWLASMKLCQSLSQGLAYLHSDLHRNGMHKPVVAHRDLSSSNVLVRADGTCALSDFGCSTILRSCSGRAGWQRSGSLEGLEGPGQVGSLRYMSPEMLEGSVDLRSGRCLVQADVYSLGLLLWEIWTRCPDLCGGGLVPQHRLPYEAELGSSLTLDRLLFHVSQMNQRPSIPEQWERQTQGAFIREVVTDCWDQDSDARLSAQCVVGRFHALQTSHSV